MPSASLVKLLDNDAFYRNLSLLDRVPAPPRVGRLLSGRWRGWGCYWTDWRHDVFAIDAAPPNSGHSPAI